MDMSAISWVDIALAIIFIVLIVVIIYQYRNCDYFPKSLPGATVVLLALAIWGLDWAISGELWQFPAAFSGVCYYGFIVGVFLGMATLILMGFLQLFFPKLTEKENETKH